jgi:DNA polymerase-3 subunit epsilon
MAKKASQPEREPVQTVLPGTNEPPEARMPDVQELGPRFAEFMERLERPIVFFDTETTGTDPQSDRIIELCALRISPPPTGIEKPRTWRINPGVRIPAEASQIHGIYNEDVANAPAFADVVDEIMGVLEGADLAGFNVGRFDIRILQSELLRVGKPMDPSTSNIVDMQVIFHQREPRNLQAALRFYRDKELENAHGAEADTIASLEVFAGQLDRYPDLPVDAKGLHGVSNAANSAFCDIGRRFVWRDGEPVFNFGKLRGKPLRRAASDPEERKYLRWMLGSDFLEDAKAIVREALDGKIRQRATE